MKRNLEMPEEKGRLNTVNLIKFDTLRQEHIMYYRKIMTTQFLLDVHLAKVFPDTNKYYILIASHNMIIGFNHRNFRLRPDYEKDTHEHGRKTRQLRKFYYQNYNYYEDSSDFRCLHPSIQIFNTLNEHYNFGFIHATKTPAKSRRFRFKSDDNFAFTECTPNESILDTMKFFYKPDYVSKVDFTASFSRISKSDSLTKTVKKVSNFFMSTPSEMASLNYRSKLYLMKKLRNIRVFLMNNVNLNLDFNKFFPYALSEVHPLENNLFHVETKTFNKDQLIYLKDLSKSSIFRGIINRKSSGFDIISLALIQGGRNVLLSNVFHTNRANPNSSAFPDVAFKPNRPVLEKETFDYQIETKEMKAKNIYSFQNASNLTEFYLHELGLTFELGVAGNSREVRDYWKVQDDQQKLLSHSVLKRGLIRVLENGQGECADLYKEYLFRDRKNLMELTLLKGIKWFLGLCTVWGYWLWLVFFCVALDSVLFCL